MKRRGWGVWCLFFALWLTGCDEHDQEMLDRLADAIHVTMEVVNNPGTGVPLTESQQVLCQYGGRTSRYRGADWNTCHVGRITFRMDDGGISFNREEAFDFAIYFNHIRGIIDVLDTDEVRIEKVKGGLYRIVPTDRFDFFRDRRILEIDYIADYWTLFESDWMPRFYITSGTLKPSVIRNTDTSSLEAFSKKILENSEENWKRHPDDQNVLQTPKTRYDRYSSMETLPWEQVSGMILPTPHTMTRNPGTADLSDGILIRGDLYGERFLAVKHLFDGMGIKMGRKGKKGYPITVSIQKAFGKGYGECCKHPESYRLHMEKTHAVIEASDEAGILYGLLSLRSLLPGDSSGIRTVPLVTVLDSPRYGYRGVMVDVARNFRPKDAICRLLDQMAVYKLNKLHLHLSDDEGWRIEIPGLPELTALGANRCHDLDERECLLPQLGSGPEKETSGSGYYTVSDYTDIVAYAKDRCIEVIPEIDMPAHARAAVLSMERRYDHYMRRGETDKALQYRLSDPDDRTSYTSVQYFDDSYVNPCMESTFLFVNRVISSLKEMHDAAGAPLKTYHFGGDETKNHYKGSGFQDIHEANPVPWKGFVDLSKEHDPFEKSPVCEAFMNASKIPLQKLPVHFAKRVSDIAVSHGIDSIAGWGDAFREIGSAGELSAGDVYVNEWNTLFWGGNSSANDFLERGFKVVQCHPDFLYFDFPYEVDPKERGYYWGTRFTDTRKVFSFAPQNLPQNAETAFDRDGKRWQDASVGSGLMNGGYTGMQVQLWGETIRTDEEMEYMAFPRLLAFAERAWHKAVWENGYQSGAVYDGTTHRVDQLALEKDWIAFSNLLGQKELLKLEKYGIRYRIPIPGATASENRVFINVPFPGLTAQYQGSDGSWRDYNPDVPPEHALSVRIRTANGKRVGRAVPLGMPSP